MDSHPSHLKPAAAVEVGMAPEALEGAGELLVTSVEARQISAASLVVARHGAVVFSRGYGRLLPDGESQPVTPDSVFLLASITKPVTACALMLLVERGLVALNDPV